MKYSAIRLPLLLAAAPVSILATSPAWADATPACNASDGADGLPSTDDDGLECGSDASATTDGVAVGNGAKDLATRGLAVGDGAMVDITGAGGTALGASSYVGQGPGVAIGDSARSSGPNAIAVGASSQGQGAGSIAVGADGADAGTEGAIAAGDNGVAIGTDASVAFGANQGVALGSGSTANHANAVAIGAGSVTSAANTVSVGAIGFERRITNVADGIAKSDAATVGQVDAAIVAASRPDNLVVSDSIAVDSLATMNIPTNLNGETVPADIGQIYIGNTTDSADAITIDSGANFPGGVAFRRYLGTPDAIQPVTAGTQLGYLDFRGYNEGFFYNAASLDVVVDGSINDTSGLMATKMRFAVSNGQTVYIPMELTAGGRLEINALGHPLGALGDPKFYVYQSAGKWNSILASGNDAGASNSFVLRLHSEGTSGSDYIIGGSSGAGAGTYKFSVRGNGDTYVGGKLFVGNRDIGAEVDAATNAIAATTTRLGAAEGQIAALDGRVSDLEQQATVANGKLNAFAVSGDGQATADGQNAVATGSNASASGSRSAAYGVDSAAQGASSLAMGSASVAAGTNSVAVGAGSNAGGPGALAFGGGANATGGQATAIGNSAVATGVNAVSLGNGARSNGQSAVAIGDASVASGQGNLAFGSAATATATKTTAIGGGSRALRDNAVAIGNKSLAQGAQGVSVGASAVVTAENSVAVGAGSAATHANATALGAGAKTTAANQVMIGTSTTAVVVAGIDASTDAQVGPVDAVTVDANGTLGRQRVATAQSVADVRVAVDYISAVTDAQFGALSGDVQALGGRVTALEQQMVLLDDKIASSTAAAVAMGGAVFLPGQKFNITANVATYDGAHAGSFQIGALVNEHVAVNAGLGTGLNKNGKTAGRVGVTLGF